MSFVLVEFSDKLFIFVKVLGKLFNRTINKFIS
jgi:hypothetical protein